MSPTWTTTVYLREGVMTTVSGEVTEADVMATVRAHQDDGIPPVVFVHSPNRIVSVPRDNIALIEHTRNPK